MAREAIPGQNDFLNAHKNMRIIPVEINQTVLQGHYEIKAQLPVTARIEETFRLKIIIPPRFPKAIPQVYELDGKIPKESKYHVFENGQLCMGAPLRLKTILSEEPNLLTFSEKILTPYLYSFCHKIKYGRYPYGELAHNAPGLVEDYKALFKVHDKEGVLRALEALSKSPRVANKLPCPCGCSQRLGKCNYRFFLSRFRNVEKRRETKETLQKTAQEKQTELHSKKHDYF